MRIINSIITFCLRGLARLPVTKPIDTYPMQPLGHLSGLRVLGLPQKTGLMYKLRSACLTATLLLLPTNVAPLMLLATTVLFCLMLCLLHPHSWHQSLSQYILRVRRPELQPVLHVSFCMTERTRARRFSKTMCYSFRCASPTLPLFGDILDNESFVATSLCMYHHVTVIVLKCT
jgi:hypothetical protein